MLQLLNFQIPLTNSLVSLFPEWGGAQQKKHLSGLALHGPNPGLDFEPIRSILPQAFTKFRFSRPKLQWLLDVVKLFPPNIILSAR